MSIEMIIDTLKKRGIKYSETDIDNKYNLLVNMYCVPEEDAAASIINYYSKSGFVSMGPKTIKISEINAPDQWVTIEGTVVSIYPGTSPSITQSGLIRDDTGVIRYVIWAKSGHAPLEKFKTYRLESVVTSEYNQLFSVGVNRNSVITPLEDKSYVDLDSIRVDYASNSVNTDIKSIKDGDWVIIRGKVMRIFDNTSPNIEQHGIIADETGSVRFVIWKKSGIEKLEEGKSYEIENAVANAYNDKISIYLNSTTTVRELEEEIKVDAIQTEEFQGAIIKVMQGSGIISRCPECNRAMQKGICATHGHVVGKKDYRIKMVVDDGVEYRNVVVGRELSEKISGITFSEATDIVANTLDNELVRATIESRILGRYVKVVGRKIDNTILATDIQPLNADEFYQAVANLLEGVDVTSSPA